MVDKQPLQNTQRYRNPAGASPPSLPERLPSLRHSLPLNALDVCDLKSTLISSWSERRACPRFVGSPIAGGLRFF